MLESSVPKDRENDDAGGNLIGDAVAAAKNRQIGVRIHIVTALQQLGVPTQAWPDFAQKFYASTEERKGSTDCFPVPMFRPPRFDRLNQSLEEWRRAADTAWQKHRDRFMKGLQFEVGKDVDEKIPPARGTRGAGRKGRRLNAPSDLRFEWTARRLSGVPFKEIAGAAFNPDQVKKAVSEVLKLASWPTKRTRA